MIRFNNFGAVLRRLLLASLIATAASVSFAAPSDEEQVDQVAMAPVSINSADAETLALALKGIGQQKAEAIVAWRESNGEFNSLDELTQVKGIGQATVDKNRGRLSL